MSGLSPMSKKERLHSNPRLFPFQFISMDFEFLNLESAFINMSNRLTIHPAQHRAMSNENIVVVNLTKNNRKIASGQHTDQIPRFHSRWTYPEIFIVGHCSVSFRIMLHPQKALIK